MDVKTQETSQVKDSLDTTKTWFNGPKKFTTVKMSPPKLDVPPKPLGINVSEQTSISEKIGG